MKFGKTLLSQSVPEWRTRYIGYRQLKKLLKPVSAARKQEEKRLQGLSTYGTVDSQTEQSATKLGLCDSQDGNFLPSPENEESMMLRTSASSSPTSFAPVSSVHRLRGDMFTVAQRTPTADSEAEDSLTSARRVPSLFSRRKSFWEPDVPSPKAPRERIPEENVFFVALQAEVIKIDGFYRDKEKDALSTIESLRMHCQITTQRSQKILGSKKTRKSVLESNSPPETSSTDTQKRPIFGEQLNRFISLTDNSNHTRKTSVTEPSPLRGFVNRSVQNLASSLHLSNMGFQPLHSHTAERVEVQPLRRTQVKQAALDFYHTLEMLRNYQVLNHTGLTKILKKFGKCSGWKPTPFFFEEYCRNEDGSSKLYWRDSKLVVKMIKEVETLFATTFTNDKRSAARIQLQLPDARTKTESFLDVVWRAGVYFGVSACLLGQTFSIVGKPGFAPSFPFFGIFLQIYGSFLMPIVFAMLFTMCFYLWSRARVNYVFIFGFDYRNHLHYVQYLEFSALFFFIWAFLTHATFSQLFNESVVPLPALPLAFFLLLMVVLLCPFPLFHQNSRLWFARTLLRIISSPFHKVQFGDFFLTDMLISQSYALSTLPLFFCFTSYAFKLSPQQLRDPTTVSEIQQACDVSKSWSVVLLVLLPPYWRLVQCIRRWYDSGDRFPHLVNALKYVCSICVVISSAAWRGTDNDVVFYMWIIFSTIATIFSFLWDVLFDWGLFQKKTEHKFLRDELFFHPNAIYYLAIVSNFFLRITWVMQLSPGFWLPQIDVAFLTFLSAMLEVIRRFQWSLYRMENEHANNCGQFRAVKEIPLPKYRPPEGDDSSQDEDAPGSGHIENVEVKDIHEHRNDTPGTPGNIGDMHLQSRRTYSLRPAELPNDIPAPQSIYGIHQGPTNFKFPPSDHLSHIVTNSHARNDKHQSEQHAHQLRPIAKLNRSMDSGDALQD